MTEFTIGLFIGAITGIFLGPIIIKTIATYIVGSKKERY